MSKVRESLCAAVFACASLVVRAQTGVDFESLPSVSAIDLKAKLSGKKFMVTAANGTIWRSEFKSNGYVVISVHGSGGHRTFSREWNAQDGQLCMKDRGVEECRSVRLDGSTLLSKIPSIEEVIAYIEQ